MPVHPLKAGQNPRAELTGHLERGPKRYGYTVNDVAALLGVSVMGVRYLVRRHGLDLDSLESICRTWLVHVRLRGPDPTMPRGKVTVG